MKRGDGGAPGLSRLLRFLPLSARRFVSAAPRVAPALPAVATRAQQRRGAGRVRGRRGAHYCRPRWLCAPRPCTEVGACRGGGAWQVLKQGWLTMNALTQQDLKILQPRI